MREPCHIEGCEKPSRGHGLCATHWARWKQHGDPYWVTPWDERKTTRKAFGCAVAGCESGHHAYGYCSRHAAAFRAHGDPLICLGRHVGRHRLDRPGYDAVHKRISRALGPASQFVCVDCGNPAHEWSYRGGSPDELVAERTGIAYSTRIEDYEPRCVRCHRAKDGSLDALNQHRPNRPPGADITVAPLT